MQYAHATQGAVLAAAQVAPLTLRKWVVRGLLPEPRRVGAGRARGSRNQWPPWAPERARWVRAQRERGLSLEAIAELVRQGAAPPAP